MSALRVVEALVAGRGDEAAVLAWLGSGGRVNATFGEGEMSGVTVLMLAAAVPNNVIGPDSSRRAAINK